MNSVKKQFGIILKLAVMLCLIGCFFIGKTSVVKAAATYVNKSESGNGELTVEITNGDSGKNYIFYAGDGTKFEKVCEWTSDGTTPKLLGTVSKNSLLSAYIKVVTSPTAGSQTIGIYVSEDNGSTKTKIFDVTTPVLYKVIASGTETAGGSANAELIPDSTTTFGGSTVAYGYAGGNVKLVAQYTPTTDIFGGWKATTGSGSDDRTTYPYSIDSSNADGSSIIEWTFKMRAAATDITLTKGTTYHDKGTIELSDGTTSYTVAIVGTGYDEKNISWSTNAPGVSVSKSSDGTTLYVENWPSSLYGSYTLTGELPNATKTGAFTAQYTLKRPSDLTAVKITGPTSGFAGGSYTYSVESTTPTSALIEDYAWYLDGGATKVATTPTYTYSSAVAGTHTVQLKVNGETKSSNTITTTIATTPKISDISISPDGVTAGYTATITATVTPKEGVQQFASGGGAKIESSDTEYFTVESYSVDTANGKISIKVKGIKHDTSKKLKFTYQSTKGVGDTVTEFTFKVYMKPKLEESSGSLKITLPDKVITGCSNDLTEVTGFRLYAYKSDIDSPIYDSGDTYKSAGKSKTLSASDVNQIVKDKSGSFSGEQDTLKFVVVPMGKRSGSDDYHRAKTSDDKVIKSDEVSVNVYRASVSGNGIIGSSAYGIAGQKVSITASPAAGYASIKWSDGSTNPTKEVTLSTSTSANQLKAEGVLGAQNPNAAGGTGGANSGDMSGYDDVPKTAESNSAIWLIVFMVFAVLGIAYALYLQLRASTSNDK